MKEQNVRCCKKKTSDVARKKRDVRCTYWR